MLGASGAAFIGGSLARVVGITCLRPRPRVFRVCFGPHTFNFALISRLLLECGAAIQVDNAAQLAEVMRDWLGDASRRTAAGEAGRQMVERNRGALDRLYALLESVL